MPSTSKNSDDTATPGTSRIGLPGILERQVVRAVRGHPLEAGKLRPQPEELLLGPRAFEPEDADLLFARDRQRVEQQRRARR